MGFTKSLNIGRYDTIGLDIGSSSVKIVQLRKRGEEYCVLAAGLEKIAPNDQYDQDAEKANTITAIRHCLEKAGVKTNKTVCGVSGPEVSVHCFEFPKLPASEIQHAILLEAAQVCPFEIQNSVVEHEVLNPDDWFNDNEKKLSASRDGAVCGIMVAATNKVIQDKRQIVKRALLDCVLMDVDSLAMLNCLIECEKPQTGQSIVCMNIGHSTANLIIVPDKGLPCIRDLPYAGADIVEQMAAELQVSPNVIEKALRNSDNSHDEQLDVTASLEKACKKLTSDILETFRYYKTQKQIPQIEKVFVGGGFSLARGFIEFLDSQIPAEVLSWNPFERMQCASRITAQDVMATNGPAMTVATGLAMRLA